MRIFDLQSRVDDDSTMNSLMDFIDFARQYISFISSSESVHPNIHEDIIYVKEVFKW